ncbi:hypothetical protein EDD27_7764 [Nonomuraea polychroma]|uniref:Secreted protein n=1 Tax=Nonomuraea polychroma TaxID=46176 RepID=A0A438MHD8_9ACTN|nr:hypothetical protein [Nonomuraea polychroma]RVX44988.1 hypothetical protein EDD27_7764 [Nonomuraea polychroma]
MKIFTQAGVLCFMLVATVLPVTAAHGATAPPAASSLSTPMCPEEAPEGGEYVRTVYAWPPYDVYRVPEPGGTYRTVNVYCR